MLGVGLLGEELPQGVAMRALAVISWCAILTGLGLLVQLPSSRVSGGESVSKARDFGSPLKRSSLGRIDALDESPFWRAVVRHEP